MHKFDREPSIFKTKDDNNYLFQVLTEDEFKELDSDIESKMLNDNFLDKYNINKKTIIAYGKTDVVTSKTLSRFIDVSITDHRVGAKVSPATKIETRKHYECFTIKDYMKCNHPIHEDFGSSWNCLLDKYHNPDYVIIYTNKKKKTLKDIQDE